MGKSASCGRAEGDDGAHDLSLAQDRRRRVGDRDYAPVLASRFILTDAHAMAGLEDGQQGTGVRRRARAAGLVDMHAIMHRCAQDLRRGPS